MEVRCINCKNYYNSMFDVCPHCGYVKGEAPNENFLLYPGMILKNRYEIGMVLGYGGFGATYKAWDNKLDTCVAIKEYFQAGVVNRIPGDKKVFVFSDKKQVEFKEGLGRFLEEARSTVKFSKHNNIVNVYDYFEENGTAYIVMEYLQGKTLKEILYENGGSLDVETSTKIFYAILHALKSVHGEKIIHRDVSPDNIFLTDSGKIKLIDFGAAKLQQKKGENRDVVVKPGFAPPEQYRVTGKQGAYTDIYAIGATMYRILTGITPDESVNRVGSDKLVPPNKIQPVIPEYLSSIIMKCLCLESELRFQDVAQVEKALKRGKTVKSRETEIKSRKLRRGIVFCVFMILCAGIGFFGNSYFRQQKQIASTEDVELTIWLCADSNNVDIEKELFNNLAKDFMEIYPNVTVTVNCYEETEFNNKLHEVTDATKGPIIFENTAVLEGGVIASEELKSIYKEIKNGTYGEALQDYSNGAENSQCVPLTCDMPITYKNVFSAEGVSVEEGTLSDFLERKCKSHVGDISSYLQIRDNLLGEYEITKSDQREFTNKVSVNDSCSKEQKKVASIFIEYMLTQNAQEELCVEKCYGIPVNSDAQNTFYNVYAELKEESK